MYQYTKLKYGIPSAVVGACTVNFAKPNTPTLKQTHTNLKPCSSCNMYDYLLIDYTYKTVQFSINAVEYRIFDCSRKRALLTATPTANE